MAKKFKEFMSHKISGPNKSAEDWLKYIEMSNRIETETIGQNAQKDLIVLLSKKGYTRTVDRAFFQKWSNGVHEIGMYFNKIYPSISAWKIGTPITDYDDEHDQ